MFTNSSTTSGPGTYLGPDVGPDMESTSSSGTPDTITMLKVFGVIGFILTLAGIIIIKIIQIRTASKEQHKIADCQDNLEAAVRSSSTFQYNTAAISP